MDSCLFTLIALHVHVLCYHLEMGNILHFSLSYISVTEPLLPQSLDSFMLTMGAPSPLPGEYISTTRLLWGIHVHCIIWQFPSRIRLLSCPDLWFLFVWFFAYEIVFYFFCRMGCRCFWDSDTDNYAQDIYMSVSYLYSFPFFVFCYYLNLFLSSVKYIVHIILFSRSSVSRATCRSLIIPFYIWAPFITSFRIIPTPF